MKKAFLAVLIIALPCIVSAQTQADYEEVAARFVKFYNANQVDNIIDMFSDKLGETHEKRARLWDNNDYLLNKYGKIISINYIGVDESDPDLGLRVFKVVATKSTHATSFSLDSTNKFLTYRFKTTSEGIEELMKKAK